MSTLSLSFLIASFRERLTLSPLSMSKLDYFTLKLKNSIEGPDPLLSVVSIQKLGVSEIG